MVGEPMKRYLDEDWSTVLSIALIAAAIGVLRRT